MAGLFMNNPETPEGKYLVQRRDGTVPDWPHFVLAASDPAAPAALLRYAEVCWQQGADEEYVRDVRDLALYFDRWRTSRGVIGDRDAPPHRTDDPEIIAKMRRGGSA
jgi:hypothetical protein